VNTSPLSAGPGRAALSILSSGFSRSGSEHHARHHYQVGELKESEIMKLRESVRASLFACAVLVAVAGCQREGPAERAGKQADQALDKAGQQIEKAGDRIRDSAQGDKK
jgi:hypothetical protein